MDKNHFGKMCRSSKGSNKYESGHDSRKLSKANGKGNSKCSHKCKFHKINECHNDMDNLTEQVQSRILQLKYIET